jgi:hypothetical protein
MAGKDINYGQYLPDVGAPDKGRAGETLISAAQSQGEAIKIGGKAKADSLTFLGTTALDAAKGKLLADESKDIKAELDKLENNPTGAQQKAVNATIQQTKDNIAANDMLMGDGWSTGQATDGVPQPFVQEASRLIAAQSQGMLSRDEVLNRMGAIVKKYSAMMPGAAAEFRKVGADMTGIDRLDVYGIHKALTTQSAAEKAAERQAALTNQAIGEIMKENGYINPSQVTGADVQRHMQRAQFRTFAEDTKAKIDNQQLMAGQADEEWGKYIAAVSADQLGALQQKVLQLSQLRSSGKTEEADAASRQLGTDLDSIGLKLVAEIGQLGKAKNPMSAGAIEKAQAKIRNDVKDWQEALKNADGRDLLKKMAENTKTRVDLFASQVELANPYITALNRLKFQPSELFTLYMTTATTPKGKEAFEKRWGSQLGDAFAQVLKNPIPHVNIMAAIAEGKPVDLNQVRATDPALAQVAAVDVIENIKSWAKDTDQSPEKKKAFVNHIIQFDKNTNLGSARDFKVASDLLNDADVQNRIKELTPEQKAIALTPIVQSAEINIKSRSDQLADAIAKYNDPALSVIAKQGHRLVLKSDPNTGLFKVEIDSSKAKPVASGAGFFSNDDPNKPAGMGVGLALGRNLKSTNLQNSSLSALKNENYQNAQAAADKLNEGVALFVTAGRMLDPTRMTKDVLMDIRTNFGATRRKDLLTGTPKADKPDASSSTDYSPEEYLGALEAAERSGDTAVSPKGAAGRYQLMPETAARYGLKVDPEAGIDERLDVEKAKKAATGYIADLSKMFNKDIAKVGAGYNAGEGSVQRAVEKAIKLNVPDQWFAFLPKPEETVPYMQRFTGHLKNLRKQQ